MKSAVFTLLFRRCLHSFGFLRLLNSFCVLSRDLFIWPILYAKFEIFSWNSLSWSCRAVLSVDSIFKVLLPFFLAHSLQIWSKFF